MGRCIQIHHPNLNRPRRSRDLLESSTDCSMDFPRPPAIFRDSLMIFWDTHISGLMSKPMVVPFYETVQHLSTIFNPARCVFRKIPWIFQSNQRFCEGYQGPRYPPLDPTSMDIDGSISGCRLYGFGPHGHGMDALHGRVQRVQRAHDDGHVAAPGTW